MTKKTWKPGWLNRWIQRFSTSKIHKTDHEPILSREQNLAAYAKHRQDRLEPFTNLPLTLQVELTQACNLRCRKCNRTYKTQEATVMSEELLEATFDIARTAKTIIPFGFGESLLFPGIADVVGRFKSLGNEVALLSNGMLLDQKISEALMLNGLDGLGVSIDAATPELFSKIREGAEFSRIAKNIETLNAIKKLHNVDHPLLGLNVVVENDNFLDLPHIMDLAEAWSVYFINFTPLVPPDHLEEEDIEPLDPSGDPPAILDLCHDKAVKSGIKINMEELTLILRKKRVSSVYQDLVSCPEPFHMMAIGASGDLSPCCRWEQGKPFAHFPDMDLKTAWTNDPWTRLRSDLQKGAYPDPCIRCMKNFSRPRGDALLNEMAAH